MRLHSRFARRLNLEMLESRLTPVVTSSVASGVLTVMSDVASDTITIGISGGNVQVNGSNPIGSPTPANTITGVTINAGGGDDIIDITAVTQSDFTILTTITAKGDAGDDTIRYASNFNGITISFAGGDDDDTLVLSGSASIVTENRSTGTTIIDGQSITQNLEVIDDQITTTDRAFILAGQFTLDEGKTAKDNVSRLTNAVSTSSFIDFTNPSGLLRIEFVGGDDSLTFGGLDPKSTPTMLQFDGGAGNDTLRLTKSVLGNTTPTKIDYDYTKGTISIDGSVLSQSAFEAIFDTLTAETRTFLSQGSDTIDGGASPGDGLSRVFVTDSPDVFTEFRNPTKSLTYSFGVGNDTLIFRGLDNTGTSPTTLTFDGGDGTDIFRLEGTTNALPTGINYNFTSVPGGANFNIVLTGEQLNSTRFEQQTDLLAVADRQFLLFDAIGSKGGASLSAGTTANDGISRLADVSGSVINNNVFIDFANPTTSLTVDGRGGDDLLIYNGIDAKNVPTSIRFIGGTGADVFRLMGTAKTVINDFTASPLSSTIDGRVVVYDTETLNDLLTVEDRTFLIRTGTTEVIEDNDTPIDGISRLQNPITGLRTEFMNPTKTLSITGSTGNETISFVALDSKILTPTVALTGGIGNDTFLVVPSESATIVVDGGAPSDLPGDTLTISTINILGAAQTGNQFTFTNRQPVTFTNIETITPFNQSTVPPPPGLPPALTAPAIRLRVGQNDTSFYTTVSGVTTRVYNGETLTSTITAFLPIESPLGVSSILADTTGDTIPELISGTGPGVIAQVRVIDVFVGTRRLTLTPFEGLFAGGVLLAAGDLNADGVSDIVVTPDSGGGGRVTVYDGRTGAVIADFFGIEDANFRGGARAAVGDINGDNLPDLIIAAGKGGGPRIAIFDGRFIVNTPIGQTPPKMIPDFFIFESTQRDGAFITAGDLDGDGSADLIASGGPGGGPRVFALNGFALSGGFIVPQANFFAFESRIRTGVRVVAKDFNNDGRTELVVASQTETKLYMPGELIGNPSDPNEITTLQPFGSGGMGIFVG